MVKSERRGSSLKFKLRQFNRSDLSSLGTKALYRPYGLFDKHTLSMVLINISPTYLRQSLRHCLGHRYGVCERLSQNHVTGIDRRLACEVDLSWRLSAMKIFYMKIICGRKVLQQDDSIHICICRWDG